MADTVTAPQKVLLRSDGQAALLYLAIPNPATIFARRVNEATVASNDMRATITYDDPDGGAGVFGSVLPGQTLYIGSSAGAYDIGTARIRKAATASVLNIGETSELAIVDNAYLTVIDDFGPWQKHVKITSAGVVKMDFDVAYTNQHTVCDPVPVMGADAVLWYQGTLGGANSITVTFNDADSWALGSTIASRVWSRLPTAGSAISSTTVANPTFTFTAPGTFRIKNTMTSAAGAVFSGYRKVVVYDNTSLPMTDFRLDSCGGDFDSGGWSFRVTLFANFDVSQIRDRAQVFLCARDWYGGVEGSVSTDTGRGNILAAGWIIGESIQSDPEQSTVSFEVAGPARWLAAMPTFPIGVEFGTASWTSFASLTVDKAYWHLLHWQSTITAITDVRKTGSTLLAAELSATAGTLWGQINEICNSTILARPACDKFGRLYCEIETNLLPVASRSTIPTVMTLTTADYKKTIQFDRRQIPLVSLLDLSGVRVNAAGKGSAFFSLANGHVPKRYGAPKRVDRMLLSTQAQANALAGLILASENNTYAFDIPLSANNRVFDIAPRQYSNISVSFRGITYAGNVLPRSINYSHNPNTGVIDVNLSCVAETTGEQYSNGDIPSAPRPPLSFPPIPPPPPPPPTPPALPGVIPVRALIVHIGTGVIYCENINDVGAKVWQSLNGTLTAAESTAITRIGVHRSGNYIYAVSPAYVLQAWFVELATSQFGLSVVMDTTNLVNMLPPIAPNGFAIIYWFSAVGVHPYSGEVLFVGGGGPLFGDLHYLFHVNTGLVVTFGATPLANSWSGEISWGDAEALLGAGNGVVTTSDFGATWAWRPIRATSGFNFGFARAGLSPILGVYADVAYGKTQASTDNAVTVTDKSTAYVPNADWFSWAANADNSVGLATVRKIADGKYYLAKTVDGGANWTEIYEQTNSGNAFRGFVWITGTVWMWGDDDKIYLSTNDGTLASTTDVTGNAKTDFPTGGNHLEVKQIEFLQ